MMLTIEDLKEKLMWEDTNNLLDLLGLSVPEALDYLTDAIEDNQDKLREYYEDENSEDVGWEKESDEPGQ